MLIYRNLGHDPGRWTETTENALGMDAETRTNTEFVVFVGESPMQRDVCS